MGPLDFVHVGLDHFAALLHQGFQLREISKARWGMPTSQKAMLDAAKARAKKLEAKGKTVDFKELLRMEPDGGTTNIRNTASPHWRRWLEPANRCVVPFTSFSHTEPAQRRE